MRFRFFILFSIILFIALSVSQKPDKGELIRFDVHQSGEFGDLYSVIVYKNQTLKASFSEITDVLEYTIFEEKKIFLSDSDFAMLEKLIEEIKKNKQFKKKLITTGGWEFDIKIGRKKFNYNWGEKENTSFSELFTEIKRLSPININLYGGGTRPLQ